MINEAVPSAVSGVNDIPSAGGDVGLKNLPCCGCRAHLVGFYSVLVEALRERGLGNGETVVPGSADLAYTRARRASLAASRLG